MHIDYRTGKKGGIIMKIYLPEGLRMDTVENKNAMRSRSALKEAQLTGQILEARAVICDNAHNLLVDLGCMQGIIPRMEGALGIEEGLVRDIALISRVNKPVCFKIMGFETNEYGSSYAVLSRRSVQIDCVNEYISQIKPGDVIDARITHLECFGAFTDIGAGITSLLPIDAISVSRIPHPGNRFNIGDDIKVVVQGIDETGRIFLSHKELLGTWEENAAGFCQGETVSGVVRSIESYGIFIELTPNLAGLAEPKEGVKTGQQASVYIKSIIPNRMKIKLVIVDTFDADYKIPRLRYFLNEKHIESWRYSPESCGRVIESVF